MGPQSFFFSFFLRNWELLFFLVKKYFLKYCKKKNGKKRKKKRSQSALIMYSPGRYTGNNFFLNAGLIDNHSIVEPSLLPAPGFLVSSIKQASVVCTGAAYCRISCWVREVY